ncbi:HAD family acid phosphatase [Horticoccus luteus]|uniref:HAD family acid phosphatase n=1 Tax=Horticoccus luteus TaxID=2862869 RepID=A0A8F9TV36_9BACT|nr:HAD family acid phosphatase [Horticoccus luteus]QYM79666.1 HAD family acid phosphatase [Horticoccus luteus]
MIRRLSLTLAGALAVFLAGCATPTTEPLNLTTAKKAVVGYVESGQYERQVQAVATEAVRTVEARVARRRAGEKLAVVFDIDETIISNLPHMRAMDFGYVPKLWDAWVDRGEGPAIAPVVEVYRTARRLGVEVFFLTGRHESDRPGTLKNLAAIGCGDFRELILKPPGTSQTTGEFKTATRRRIMESGYAIIANIGDQVSDLEGGFAERTFKLPGPFYIVQ